MEQPQFQQSRPKDGIDYFEGGLSNIGNTLENFFSFLKDAFKSLYYSIEDFWYWITGDNNGY